MFRGLERTSAKIDQRYLRPHYVHEAAKTAALVSRAVTAGRAADESDEQHRSYVFRNSSLTERNAVVTVRC